MTLAMCQNTRSAAGRREQRAMAGSESCSRSNFLEVLVFLTTVITVCHCFTLDLKNSTYQVRPNTDVSFVCEAKDIRFTDRVQWVKKVNTNSYRIYDGMIQHPFMLTERYNVKNNVNSRGQFQDITSYLNITAVQPEDAGAIGCRVNSQMVLGELKVFGPIKYVKLVRTTISGQSFPLANGQYVMFGDNDGLECEVKAIGTSPKVKVMIGDMEVTRSYNLQEVSTEKDNAGLVIQSKTVTLSTSVLRLSPSDNNQKLRCVASAPNYLDMESNVIIGMKAKPKVKCADVVEASVGEETFSIVCHVLSNPVADSITWSFSKSDSSIINLTGDQTLGAYSSMSTVSNFNYTVKLIIHDVSEEHFRDYRLVVANEEGQDEATVSLSKNNITITPPSYAFGSKGTGFSTAGSVTDGPTGSSQRIGGLTVWSSLLVLCTCFLHTKVL
ncbi:uncharacterized protein LOC106165959 [Lingula anatina]|uniref:Uncharacterized protein LOC106165959 n=1 Tax=Lingula anatina TaxID=7574 RepID=A0A1S3IPG1_LINAN|nr:uncharacterized protein LOC106165959 [Lingula anatina]|eukprot:XP_013399796.1 uncharacterized protein LOC106165959 [Lingula anatina]